MDSRYYSGPLESRESNTEIGDIRRPWRVFLKRRRSAIPVIVGSGIYSDFWWFWAVEGRLLRARGLVFGD
ncbi:uncharacterized protein BDR25DRAFT_356174 [Lindgomyces ingoldianus]|uniref:Uncharacterized protein n=1 Tax=Lindgomyces ingoldianus TaxID=673940 RepID=A0ACB6QTP9_9PLEO|nr:uncharacterized protein BDR25DRAFT_356174 [Lindgomyces ingoldianus]KAF2469900.1 hypothetical protein BDR25DRAFT_356174 [Lindgomyces ingoldianus]